MNKKNLTLTVIAVLTLLIVVVSATFAYFTAIINTEGNSTTIVSGSAESVGTVSLSNPTEDLHITLSATDMASDNLGVYYATDSTTANYDTTEVQRNIAVAVVSGGTAATKYECSATINIALSGTMAESLVAGDAYVQFGGLIDDKVHLSKVASEGYKVIFQLDGNTNTSKSVSASIAIENKMQNQNNLAGKSLTATFSNDDFECRVVKEYADTTEVAFAIYSETDNSLKFYKRSEVPEVGDTFNGNVVTAIYTGFEDEEYAFDHDLIEDLSGSDDVPWHGSDANITNVEVVDEIIPKSTKGWFYDFVDCETIDVTNLNVSKVTDMSYMFAITWAYLDSFEIIGLEGWDTSNVTNMEGMFYSDSSNFTAFDIGDLSNWDVTNVTNMEGMFWNAGSGASIFDIGNLSNWDTSSVTDMSYMFFQAGFDATTFNIGDLSNWNTSNVTDISGMFNSIGYSATTFDIGDLSSWDVSNVTNMNRMFAWAGTNATTFDVGNLSNWDTSKVIDMECMFWGTGEEATTFDIGDISSWDTSNVTNMSHMFNGAGKNADWSLDLSGWDVSKVTGVDIHNFPFYYKFNLEVEDKVTPPNWVS